MRFALDRAAGAASRRAAGDRRPFAAPVPYAVGEELTYRATFGGLHAGTARMRVDGIEIVRGRPAYHVVFSVDGGIPFFRVHDRYESWIDVETLASLRHRQQISEGHYHRTTSYEIYPERARVPEGRRFSAGERCESAGRWLVHLRGAHGGHSRW